MSAASSTPLGSEDLSYFLHVSCEQHTTWKWGPFLFLACQLRAAHHLEVRTFLISCMSAASSTPLGCEDLSYFLHVSCEQHPTWKWEPFLFLACQLRAAHHLEVRTFLISCLSAYDQHTTWKWGPFLFLACQLRAAHHLEVRTFLISCMSAASSTPLGSEDLWIYCMSAAMSAPHVEAAPLQHPHLEVRTFLFLACQLSSTAGSDPCSTPTWKWEPFLFLACQLTISTLAAPPLGSEDLSYFLHVSWRAVPPAAHHLEVRTFFFFLACQLKSSTPAAPPLACQLTSSTPAAPPLGSEDFFMSCMSADKQYPHITPLGSEDLFISCMSAASSTPRGSEDLSYLLHVSWRPAPPQHTTSSDGPCIFL